MSGIAVADDAPAAAGSIRDSGFRRDSGFAQPLAQVVEHCRFAMKQMRRARDVDEDAVRRIGRDQRRIHHTPDREPIKRRRDREQAEAVAALVATHLPQLPFEADALRMLPADLVAELKPLFVARTTGSAFDP